MRPTFSAEDSDINRYLYEHKTLVCATTASLLSTLAGYPLDSLKSRLQASRTPITVPRLAANVFREEGIAGFFRGIWIPLVTISAVRAASFTIYTETKDFLHRRHYAERPRVWDVAWGAAVGGVASGAVISCGSTPFELVKIRRQLEYSIAAAKGVTVVKPPNTVQAVQEIVRAKGVFGLYQGFRLHFWRDMLGSGLYFGEYEALRQILGRLPDGRQGDSPRWAPIPQSLIPFTCGSIAGVTSWALIYPLDVVKTKVQQRALAGAPYRSILVTAKRMVRGPDPDNPKTFLRGMARIYQGLGVSAARSVLTHGFLWTIYESVGDWIDRNSGHTKQL